MVFDYYFSRRKAGEQPHIYNYFLDKQPSYDIEIQLPTVMEAPISFEDETEDEPWFRLEKSSDPNDPDKLVVSSKIWGFTVASFQKEVKDDSVWTENYVDSIRTKVVDDYKKFLIDLEDSGLGPNAIQLVKTRLAEVIPVTFTELLFYHYGLNQAEGYVDLQPGMRLRVDHQSYQLVHPAQDQRLHGYTGGGSSYYQVATHRTVTNEGEVQINLSFDPFVAGMQNTIVETGAGDGSSVAGVIDLQKPAYRKPYLRLFYPDAYPGVSSAGWSGTEKNVTLVSADTIANLDAVTEQYLKNGAVSGEGVQAIYFRGRAAVIPELVIFVNGQPEYVALGTTVRQLLDRYLSVPAAMDGQNLGDLGVQGVQRLLHQGPEGLPVYRTVHFEHYQAYADDTDVYDIPLLKGDKIRIG